MEAGGKLGMNMLGGHPWGSPQKQASKIVGRWWWFGLEEGCDVTAAERVGLGGV